MITVLGRLYRAVLFVISSRKNQPPSGILKKKEKGADPMMIKNFNEEQFQQAIASGDVVLVDFWAPWCGYCRRIEPVYGKIAQQYGDRMIVAKVNIDEQPRLADMERIEVIPTLVLYRDGQALGSIVAPQSKAVIDDFIREKLEA